MLIGVYSKAKRSDGARLWIIKVNQINWNNSFEVITNRLDRSREIKVWKVNATVSKWSRNGKIVIDGIILVRPLDLEIVSYEYDIKWWLQKSIKTTVGIIGMGNQRNN